MKLKTIVTLLLIFVVSAMIAVTINPSLLELGRKPEPIKILTDNWIGYTPIDVAKSEGYFEDHGLDVELFHREAVGYVEGSEMLQYDVVLYGLTTFMIDQSDEWEVSAPIDISTGADKIILRSSTVDDKSKLIGEKVVVYGKQVALPLVFKYLEEKGLSPTDMDIEIIQPTEGRALDFFEDTNVQIVSAWEPYASKLLKKYPQATTITTSADYYGLISDVITFRSDVPMRKREKIVKAIYDAIALYNENPDLYISIAARNVNTKPDELKRELAQIRLTGYREYNSLMGQPPKFENGIIRRYYDLAVQVNEDFDRTLNIKGDYDDRVKPLTIKNN